MSGTYAATMGDRGRLVVPAELRESAGLTEGKRLTFIEVDGGLLLVTREQLRDLVRRDLSAGGLVEKLLRERRANAISEDSQ